MKNPGYCLSGEGFGDLKNFSPKPMPRKAFGHLMIFLTFDKN
jgi:hypothetical protein